MQKIQLGKKIVKELKKHGHQAYFVGGFVRDYILKKEINDIDIATSAHPEQVMGIFSKSIPTGLKHGTVTVILEKIPFEVTTFRREEDYKDHRHPEKVIFVSSIIQDLSRRDFTMNAMAMDEEETILDPFDGQIALKQRRIIAVGDPTLRFLEDPLRMMRAIRFAAQLDFIIDAPTWEAISEKKEFIQHIAVERIKGELDKIIVSNHPDKGIELLFSSGMVYWIKNLEGIISRDVDFKDTTERIQRTSDLDIRWFLFLFVLNDANYNKIMEAFKFSNKEKRMIDSLFQTFKLLRDSFCVDNIKRCLVESNEIVCQKAFEILYLLDLINNDTYAKHRMLIKEINQDLKVRSLKDLAISGQDIIHFFQRPSGPWVKEILQFLIEAVIYDDIENKKEILLQKAVEGMKEKYDAR